MALSGAAQAQDTHYGHADPLSEGWTLEPTDNGAGVSAIASDSDFPGTSAWQVDNSTQRTRYRLDGPAVSSSWTLGARMRVVDFPDAADANILLEVADGVTRWLASFGSEADADTVIAFAGGVTSTIPVGQPTFTDYLFVEIASDGISVDVFVDGVEVESNWTGVAGSFSRVNFGDGQTSLTGRSRTQYVDFAIGAQACRDGIDNDGDGLTDFAGGELGCSQPNDPSEDDTDRDGDGLDDLSEIAAGTALANPDTDGDGFDDGTEVSFGTDPLDALDSLIDTKIVASDAAAADMFGYAVSVSGDTLVVGARLDDDGGTDSGSAYVYTRSGSTWSFQQKLAASDAAAVDRFGHSVAVSGDTLVVGAYADDDGGSASGSAYVFTRSGSTWSEQQKLVASDAATNDIFGWSVAADGDTVLIGAYGNDDAGSSSGSAYVFTRNGSVWSEQQKLVASDAAIGDEFGRNVSLLGDTAVIGAPRDNGAETQSGAAYVFTRSASVWSEEQTLVASDPIEDHRFGWSVSVSGDTALIGAYRDNNGFVLAAGAAYVFRRGSSGWSEEQKLVASDPTSSTSFGFSVSVSGDTALIGRSEGAASGTGSAYVFTRNGSAWSEQQKLSAIDGAAVDSFGASVSLSGHQAIVGAREDDDSGADSGSVYVIDVDLDGDGLLNAAEGISGTDLLDPDSDDDGLLDGFEVSNGFDPLGTDESNDDPDQDSLSNLDEQAAGTDPNAEDTDSDGFNDAAELAAGTDPLDPLDFPTSVPALGGLGLAVLAALLAGTGAWRRI
jgi:hypothetical protein